MIENGLVWGLLHGAQLAIVLVLLLVTFLGDKEK